MLRGFMKKLKKFCVVGAIFTSVMGIISHFVYEWSGNNFLVGLFFPVNESTWEHLKLLFFPMLAYSLIAGKRLEQQYPCIYNALFTGILVGMGLIPVLFYTYSGILGKDVAWVNILIYIISVIAAFTVVYKRATAPCNEESKVLRFVMYGFILAFMMFTVYPPELGIFTVVTFVP